MSSKSLYYLMNILICVAGSNPVDVQLRGPPLQTLNSVRAYEPTPYIGLILFWTYCLHDLVDQPHPYVTLALNPILIRACRPIGAQPILIRPYYQTKAYISSAIL